MSRLPPPLRAVAPLALVALSLLRPLAAGAVELTALRADGSSPGEGAVHQTFGGYEIAVHDQVAAVRASYQVRNDSDQSVEITCRVAVGRGEKIDGFSYWNGAERIVGEVLEKQAAEEVYQELTGVQRDPGILGLDGDAFRFRVFPVEPGETKPVELRSVDVLEREAGWITLAIPRRNLPPAGATFALHLDLSDDLPIAEVQTEGFEGLMRRLGPRRVRIVFEDDGAAFDGDLIIRYRLEAPETALRVVTHREGEGDGTFMLLLSPAAHVDKAAVAGRDLIFVLDVSGSMDGLPLQQTRAALRSIVPQLRAGDRFDVVTFSDEPKSLFGGLREADEASRAAAMAAAEGLRVEGGTNIRGALAAALATLARAEPADDPRPRPKAVFFLTDGQGNSPAGTILADVRRRAEGARLFTFGAGTGVDRAFLRRLARDNRGVATFIDGAADIEADVVAAFERIAVPLLLDVEARFEGLEITDRYPRQLTDLYADGDVILFGRYRGGGAGQLRVTARGPAGPVVLEQAVHFEAHQPAHGYIEKLWAARRIDHLADQLALGTLDGAGDEARDARIAEMTRLGIVYNLVTPYTTFLAVPESLQTEAIKAAMRAGRQGQGKRLADTMAGVRLSQRFLPPGDPVLSVRAPAHALRVVAWFPFGVVKRLRWDAARDHWSVRFLVPRDVPDGDYVVRVQIVHSNGQTEWRETPITIDGTAPEFDVDVPEEAAPGQSIHVSVDPFEPVGSVVAFVRGADPQPLTLDPDGRRWSGLVLLPDRFEDGQVTVRVVVRDRARNRHERDLVVRASAAATWLDEGDGCGPSLGERSAR